MMMRYTGPGLAVLAVAAVACASGVRPGYSPFPQAEVDTVNATPTQAIQELVQGLGREAITLQWSSPEEGYLESMWYNVVTRESGQTDRGNPDRFIKVRFWADPLGTDRAIVTAEAVTWRTTDPSIAIERQKEMLVPPGHAGENILRRVLQGLNERYGG